MDNSSELHAVDNLSEELRRELEQNILPFWLHRMTAATADSSDG